MQPVDWRQKPLQALAGTSPSPLKMFFLGIIQSDEIIQVEKEVGNRNRAVIPVLSTLIDGKFERQ